MKRIIVMLQSEFQNFFVCKALADYQISALFFPSEYPVMIVETK